MVIWNLLVGPRLHSWLTEYLRFAAGGFVFMSGLTLAAVALGRMDRGMTPRGLWTWCWRRAFYILLMHYAATLGFYLLEPFKSVQHQFPPVIDVLAGVLLLRRGYGTDLLPFYVIMLLVTPALVLMIRARLGALVLAGSAAVFWWASRGHNYEHFPLPLQEDFFVLLWQLMFAFGMVAGAWLPRYDRLSSIVPAGAAAGGGGVGAGEHHAGVRAVVGVGFSVPDLLRQKAHDGRRGMAVYQLDVGAVFFGGPSRAVGDWRARGGGGGAVGPQEPGAVCAARVRCDLCADGGDAGRLGGGDQPAVDRADARGALGAGGRHGSQATGKLDRPAGGVVAGLSPSRARRRGRCSGWGRRGWRCSSSVRRSRA